jgi:hypothetical protein
MRIPAHIQQIVTDGESSTRGSHITHQTRVGAGGLKLLELLRDRRSRKRTN